VKTDPTERWQPDSWQKYPALQQPDWPDKTELDITLEELASYPPLVVCRRSPVFEEIIRRGSPWRGIHDSGRGLC